VTPFTDWPEVVASLRKTGIEFDTGLTDAEVERTEQRFGFRFPPDLRAFLQTGLPVGEGFPNWRSADEAELREWLNLPLEGILFDIENNGFWLPEWGPTPPSLDVALQTARQLVRQAPRLIPVYRHRMIPDDPHAAGNPVFSVHQTDIIHYGLDLVDYLQHEFGLPGRNMTPSEARPIRFWDIDRFQEVRWANGSCASDNRRGILPSE